MGEKVKQNKLNGFGIEIELITTVTVFVQDLKGNEAASRLVTSRTKSVPVLMGTSIVLVPQ